MARAPASLRDKRFTLVQSNVLTDLGDVADAGLCDATPRGVWLLRFRCIVKLGCIPAYPCVGSTRKPADTALFHLGHIRNCKWPLMAWISLILIRS